MRENVSGRSSFHLRDICDRRTLENHLNLSHRWLVLGNSLLSTEGFRVCCNYLHILFMLDERAYVVSIILPGHNLKLHKVFVFGVGFRIGIILYALLHVSVWSRIHV